MHHLVDVTCAPNRPGSEVDLLVDTLWALGAIGVQELDGVLRGAFDDEAAALLAAKRLGATCLQVDDREGLDAWRAFAEVYRAGPFVIRPPWLDTVPDAANLVIDPGAAFGSGSHPSTRLLLGLLPGLVSPGSRVVDLGTGSGVLAIAAALLGASVTAVDTDPAAADAVAVNCAANQVADRVRFSMGDACQVKGHFDVGLCNMTIDLHEHLGPLLTAEFATLVVGGILQGEQEARVCAAHERQIDTRQVEGEWAALVLR